MEQEKENDLTPDPAFVQGMNEGYILAKYMPEVADGLYKIVSDSERIQGFKAGREEFMREKLTERMKSWDDKEKRVHPTPQKDQDIDKSIGDLEHEWEKE